MPSFVKIGSFKVLLGQKHKNTMFYVAAWVSYLSPSFYSKCLSLDWKHLTFVTDQVEAYSLLFSSSNGNEENVELDQSLILKMNSLNRWKVGWWWWAKNAGTRNANAKNSGLKLSFHSNLNPTMVFSWPLKIIRKP